MKILITGAGGLVGTELTRALASNHDVLPLTHAELDVRNRDAIKKVFSEAKPALVFNCAVLGVDACEMNPRLAREVNVIGAENLAKAAAKVRAEFIQFSTNYVFDGTRVGGAPYTIDDTPAPINVYGETKLAGELAVKAACKRSFIIRTSLVFGAGKQNFLSTIPRSLTSGAKVRAITDVWANTTYVKDLVSQVMKIISQRHFDTYHVVNSGVCSYFEFAMSVAKQLEEFETRTSHLIEPIKLEDLHLRADRPRYTPMRCIVSKKLGIVSLRHWCEALAEYLTEEATPNLSNHR